MIVKDLLGQCPEKQIVSAVLDLCGADQAERDGVAQNYLAFLEKLRQIQPLETGCPLLGVSFVDKENEVLDVSVYRKKISRRCALTGSSGLKILMHYPWMNSRKKRRSGSTTAKAVGSG